MKGLEQNWEKLFFAVVLLIVIAVIGKTVAAGGACDTFEAKDPANVVPESALVGIPGLVANASAPSPALERNVFTHDWLQRSTANTAALTKKWGEKCDETGQMILYRADADGDGIPNEWEKKFGLDWTDPTDAEKDFDNDSFTNLQEFKFSEQEIAADPKDPKTPNVAAQDWRIGKIFHPERNLQLAMFAKGQNLTFKYDGKNLPKVALDATQFETKDGKVFFISSVEEVNNEKGKFEDYKVTVKDGETGEEFACYRKQKALEAYGIVELVSKEDANKKFTLKVGEEIELPMVKKNGTVTDINVEDKTVTVKVNDIEYTISE